MASDNEASCESDPNFAVICAFLEKFGLTCGLAEVDFMALQEMLEDTQEVPQVLVDMHLKLLRKTKKSVSADRWEKALVKFCHTFCAQDAWEIERFGYKKARLSSKIRALKELLEAQFDCNPKFKTEINKMTARDLRSQPLGKDKSGHAYWFQSDNNCQIRVYKEDPDEETWILVARDKDGLINLINDLGDGDSKISSESTNNEDSNSLAEKPIIDTGQTESNSSDSKNQPLELPQDEDACNGDFEEDIGEEEEADEEELDEKEEELGEEEEDLDEEEEELDEEEEKEEDDDDDDDAVEKEEDVNEDKKEKRKKTRTPLKSIDKNGKKKRSRGSSDGEDKPSAKKKRTSAFEVGEAIEEPVMLVKGVGSGADNEGIPIVGEAIEESVMYFYGSGNGRDCETGNDDKPSNDEESFVDKNSISDNKDDGTASSKQVTAPLVKSPIKLGTIIDTKTDNKLVSSTAKSPTKKSRWDVETKRSDDSTVEESVDATDKEPEQPKAVVTPKFFFGPGCLAFKSKQPTPSFSLSTPEGSKRDSDICDQKNIIESKTKGDIGYRIEGNHSVESSGEPGKQIEHTNDQKKSEEVPSVVNSNTSRSDPADEIATLERLEAEPKSEDLYQKQKTPTTDITADRGAKAENDTKLVEVKNERAKTKPLPDPQLLLKHVAHDELSKKVPVEVTSEEKVTADVSSKEKLALEVAPKDKVTTLKIATEVASKNVTVKVAPKEKVPAEVAPSKEKVPAEVAPSKENVTSGEVNLSKLPPSPAAQKKPVAPVSIQVTDKPARASVSPKENVTAGVLSKEKVTATIDSKEIVTKEVELKENVTAEAASKSSATVKSVEEKIAASPVVLKKTDVSKSDQVIGEPVTEEVCVKKQAYTCGAKTETSDTKEKSQVDSAGPAKVTMDAKVVTPQAEEKTHTKNKPIPAKTSEKLIEATEKPCIKKIAYVCGTGDENEEVAKKQAESGSSSVKSKDLTTIPGAAVDLKKNANIPEQPKSSSAAKAMAESSQKHTKDIPSAAEKRKAAADPIRNVEKHELRKPDGSSTEVEKQPKLSPQEVKNTALPKAMTEKVMLEKQIPTITAESSKKMTLVPVGVSDTKKVTNENSDKLGQEQPKVPGDKVVPKGNIPTSQQITFKEKGSLLQKVEKPAEPTPVVAAQCLTAQLIKETDGTVGVGKPEDLKGLSKAPEVQSTSEELKRKLQKEGRKEDGIKTVCPAKCEDGLSEVTQVKTEESEKVNFGVVHKELNKGATKVAPPKVESSEVGTSKIELSEVSSSKVEPSKAAPPKVVSPKVELLKLAAPRIEPSKVAHPKVDLSRDKPVSVEASKASSSKPESSTPKIELSKVAHPKVDLSKNKPVTVEASKASSSKLESSSGKIELSKVTHPKVDLSKDEPVTVETSKVSSSNAETSKTAPPEVESPKVEPLKVAPQKVEPTKTEHLKVDQSTVAQSIIAPTKLEPSKVASSKVEPLQVTLLKVESPKIESPKVEAVKVELSKGEPSKVGLSRAASLKVESSKVGDLKSEPQKVEPPNTELPKVDSSEVVPSKVGPSNATPSTVEPPKVELPKVESAKVEPPKVDLSKVARPKVEPSKVAPAKSRPSNSDCLKAAPPKVEASKVEASKIASPKVGLSNAASSKVEDLKVAPSKRELSKVEPLKASPREVELPKVGPLKAAPPKVAPLQLAPPKAASPQVAPLKVVAELSRTSKTIVQNLSHVSQKVDEGKSKELKTDIGEKEANIAGVKPKKFPVLKSSDPSVAIETKTALKPVEEKQAEKIRLTELMNKKEITIKRIGAPSKSPETVQKPKTLEKNQAAPGKIVKEALSAGEGKLLKDGNKTKQKEKAQDTKDAVDSKVVSDEHKVVPKEQTPAKTVTKKVVGETVVVSKKPVVCENLRVLRGKRVFREIETPKTTTTPEKPDDLKIEEKATVEEKEVAVEETAAPETVIEPVQNNKRGRKSKVELPPPRTTRRTRSAKNEPPEAEVALVDDDLGASNQEESLPVKGRKGRAKSSGKVDLENRECKKMKMTETPEPTSGRTTRQTRSKLARDESLQVQPSTENQPKESKPADEPKPEDKLKSKDAPKPKDGDGSKLVTLSKEDKPQKSPEVATEPIFVESSDDDSCAIVEMGGDDPLAVSDEEEEEQDKAKESQSVSLANFSLDFSDSPVTTPAPVKGRRKRGRESSPVQSEATPSGKRIKMRGKRSVDTQLRKSIEEAKNQELASSGDDQKDDENEEQKLDKKHKTANKHKRILNNLGINPDQMDQIDAGMGVRQSRRIAQLKIREEAERRKLEEEITKVSMLEFKKKKNKKDMDKSYKGEKKPKNVAVIVLDDDDDDDEKEEDSSKKRKKKKHAWNPKKFNQFNAWRSSSGSSSENAEEEEEEQEESDDERVPDIYVSDHEFSPESDLENDADYQPLKRARTVKKESDVEDEVDDCPCQKCNKSDHPEWILLCDKCDNGWHCSCLRPPLLVIPEGDWYCPPCQHANLIQNLQNKLTEHNKNLNKKSIADRRKERLAYVGITLNNVLPAKETTTEHAKKLRKKPNRGNRNSNEDGSSRSEGGSGSSESESESDSDDEPIYQLRQRRQAHSYRFNDYDDLINSAIQDEMEAVKSAGNQGRGKDIATIVNAEKEEEKKKTEVSGEEAVAVPADGDQNLPEPLPPVVPPHETEEQRDVYSDDDDVVKPPKKKAFGKKKHRKLNSLDVSSGDDDNSDEDFKGTSSDSDEDPDDDLGSDESDSELDARRGRKGRNCPVRRSTRARVARYDADFIDDNNSDSDEAPRRKKKRSIWDESEEESEESDKSWGRRKRKPASSRRKSSAPSTNSKKKKKKKKRREDDSDAEVYRKKKPKIKFGLDDDDDGPVRRTRGKKITYVDALGSDSDDDRPKRAPPRIESEEEYVADEDEDEMDEEDKISEEEKGDEADSSEELASTKKDKNKTDEAKTVAAKVPDSIEQMNKNLEDADENEMEKMMEDEEYANKQLQLVALQLEKEKKRKAQETMQTIKKPEVTPEPKKRGRKPKNQFQFPPHETADSLNAENDELSEPPGVSIPLFSELTGGNDNEDIGMKKRGGRGKNKKSLEEAVVNLGTTGRPPESGGPPYQDSNIEIAAPPQPFSQSQPTPSVITRMLQNKPGQPGYPVGSIRPKQFASMPEDEASPGTPLLSHHAMGSQHGGQFPPGGMRPQMSSPYRQQQMNHYSRGAPPPHQLRMFHPHRPMDPSPSGGGAITMTEHSPGRVASPASGSPGGNNGGPGKETPPPPYQQRPPTMGRYPPMGGSPAPPGSRHVPHGIPPHLSGGPPPRANMSPYHSNVAPPGGYHYGSYQQPPPPPPIAGGDESMAAAYQNAVPPYPAPEQFPHEGPAESSRPYDEAEAGGGEFGGLVSYFSSQREDDLES